MNPAPAASVIIPALNAEQTLPDLLAALKAQSGVPGPFEIFVVDNGSTDRTAEIAHARGVTVLHQPVRGPAAARIGTLGSRMPRGGKSSPVVMRTRFRPGAGWPHCSPRLPTAKAFKPPAPFTVGNPVLPPSGSPVREKFSIAKTPPAIPAIPSPTA